MWETLRIGIKPYPACRYTHAAIDGLLELQRRNQWAPDNVTSIAVGLHRNGIAMVGVPLDGKRRARSVVDGQFSMPFAAAVALLRGQFGWDDYDLLGTPEADVLAARVDVRRDETLEGLRHPFGATLEVAAAGTTQRLRIPDPSGERETFPDAAACARKFHSLATPVLNQSTGIWLDRLNRLATTRSVRQMFR